MHENEIPIDDAFVRQLITEQFPAWSDLPIKKIDHFGTDNVIFQLGDDKCIRLPRLASSSEQITKEQQWLPVLTPYLPCLIPTPLKEGKPTKEYPFDWSIYHWLDGTDAHHTKIENRNQAASDLAHFITSLQTIDTNKAPYSRRGKPLNTQDQAVRHALNTLQGTVDTQKALAIWEECVTAPQWGKANVWLHGDLLPPNILIKDDKLHAIIDFGLMGVGDPACDLIPAWCLFDSESRKLFKHKLAMDEHSWLRGKGWALSIALIIIPYYKDSNPVLVSVAKRMIDEMMLEC